MDAPDIVELLDEQQFENYLSQGGVIVIHDDANRAAAKRVAHVQQERKACSHVGIDDFRLKVLANAQANGHYWWARNSKAAERELGASLCTESRRLLGRQ